MTEWFPHLADVPNVGYVPDPSVVRATLPGHDRAPQLNVYTFDGQPRETLIWHSRNGSTSASPAFDYSSIYLQDPTASSEALIQRLHETLELPGTMSDYHFAILRCVEQLWERRRQEPELLGEIERLCWLDIRVVEGRPHAFTYEREGVTGFYGMPAFGHLIELFEREGFLAGRSRWRNGRSASGKSRHPQNFAIGSRVWTRKAHERTATR